MKDDPQNQLGKSDFGHKYDANSAKFRLIDAVLDSWAYAPVDSISVRALVRKADAAQSSIHYHFEDLERLYKAASDAALTMALDWMEARLSEIAVLASSDLPLHLQASIIASTVSDWTNEQRRLAMAARYAPGTHWQAAMDRFWMRCAELLGLSDHAATIAFYAVGETARHLLIWHPPLDRALLEETASSLLLWLRHRQFGTDGARSVHQGLARSTYRHAARGNDALVGIVEQAAADLLAEHGYAGVTFRAVAERAGVTLGKVIHLCGTKSELLHGALHRLYEREALGDDRELFMAQNIAPQIMLANLLDAVIGGDQPVLRAYDEIERAIYNGPEYAALRGVVRSMEDPSGTWALQQMLAGAQPPASLVAGFSAIIRGIGERASAGVPNPDLKRQAHATFGLFMHQAE